MDVYDMSPHEFYIDKRTVLEDGNLLYDLIPIIESNICPLCGGEGKKNGKYRPRKVRDLPQSFSQVGLQIHSHRFLCKDCGNSWVNEYQSVDNNSQLTNRLRDYIRHKSLQMPFKTLADELSLSDATIKRVFDDFIRELETQNVLYPPEVLGIDENHLLGNYRAIFVDVKERVLIDMLPKRSKKSIVNFLKSIPDNHNIQVVTMDMWKPYRNAVHEVLPNAVIVIDKFHVIKEVQNTLEIIRRNLKNQIDKSERKYLRNNKFLLLTDREKLNKSQEQKLAALFERFPQFKRPYHMKEMIRDIYHQPTKADAERWYFNIKGLLSDYEGADEFFDVCKTVDNWYDEIFNYFDYQYTNAITESINRQINEISSQGRGYSFEILRAKAVFIRNAKKAGKFSFPT